MALRLAIAFYCCLTVHLLVAQTAPSTTVFEPSYKNYTTDNGLESNETYHVIQDKKGYIWVSSDRGVSRFDGKKFETFGLDDGMTDDAVYKFHEDSQGRIWMVCGNGSFCYYENESFHAYEYNDTIAAYSVLNDLPLGIAVEPNGTIYVNTKANGLLQINADGNAQIHDDADSTYYEPEIDGLVDHYTWRHFESSNTILRYQSTRAFYSIIHKALAKVKYVIVASDEQQRQDTIRSFSTLLDTTNWFQEQSVPYGSAISADSMLLTVHGNSWVLVTPDTIRRFTEKTGITNIQYLGGYIWISLRNLGVNRYDPQHLDDEPANFLNKNTVTAVEVDHQGSHWFSTLEHGLFYCANIGMKSIKPPSFCSNSRAFYLGKNQFYVVYDNGWLQRTEGNISTWTNLQPKGLLAGSMYDKTRDIITVSGNEMHTLQAGKLIAKSSTVNPAIKSMIYLPNGGFYAQIGYRSIFTSGSDTIHRIMEIEELEGLALLDTLLVLRQRNQYMIKRGNTILSWDFGNKNWPADYEAFVGYDQQYFLHTKSGDLYGTQDSTLTLISNSIPKTSKINCIAFTGEKYYVGTSSGEGIMEINSSGNIRFITTTGGLLDNAIIGLEIRSDTLWVSTKAGVSVVPIDKIKAPALPRVLLEHIIMSDDEQLLADTIYSTYDKNRLDVELNLLSFRSGAETVIQYQLLGEDPIPVTTNGTTLHYSSLEPGTYTFTYNATLDGINYSTPQQFTVIISPPFWLTWWFIIIAVLLDLGVIYLIIRWRIGVRTKKSAIASQLLELRSSALRAQMNPHFTYNALNSIQSLIASNDTEKAAITSLSFHS
jgi:ligand-binding sensor domain-containing protein